MTATKTTLTLRVVNHNKVHNNYAVWEMLASGDLQKVTKDYNHSTSAYAALGRLMQKELIANKVIRQA